MENGHHHAEGEPECGDHHAGDAQDVSLGRAAGRAGARSTANGSCRTLEQHRRAGGDQYQAPDVDQDDAHRGFSSLLASANVAARGVIGSSETSFRASSIANLGSNGRSPGLCQTTVTSKYAPSSATMSPTLGGASKLRL